MKIELLKYKSHGTCNFYKNKHGKWNTTCVYNKMGQDLYKICTMMGNEI